MVVVVVVVVSSPRQFAATIVATQVRVTNAIHCPTGNVRRRLDDTSTRSSDILVRRERIAHATDTPMPYQWVSWRDTPTFLRTSHVP